MTYKIDLTNPNNLSDKVLPEEESRYRILLHAKKVGCLKEMKKIFSHYDKLLRNCTNTKERDDISKLAVYEVYRLLGGGGELYVNGQLVAKDN
jgi:hypothetical protein